MDVELLSFGVTHRLFLKYGLLENSSCILVLSLFMILPFYKPSISSGISRLATFDCQMVDLWISYYYPIILPIKAVYIYIHIDQIINPPCIGLKWDWINVQLHEFDFPHGDRIGWTRTSLPGGTPWSGARFYGSKWMWNGSNISLFILKVGTSFCVFPSNNSGIVGIWSPNDIDT